MRMNPTQGRMKKKSGGVIASSYSNGHGDKMTRTDSSLAMLCAPLRYVSKSMCRLAVVFGPLTRPSAVTHFCATTVAKGTGKWNSVSQIGSASKLSKRRMFNVQRSPVDHPSIITHSSRARGCGSDGMGREE